MKFESPTQSRLIYFQTADSKSVRIPVTKKWFLIAFVGIWLTLWMGGGLFAFWVLFIDAPDPFTGVFMAVWLIGWAIGTAVVVYYWLWAMFGNTTLTIGKGALSVGKHLPYWSRFKHYKLDEVREMVWEETHLRDKKNRSVEWEQGKGRIEFRHGAQRKVAVKGVTKDEGKEIIDALTIAAGQDLTRKG